VNSQKAKRYLTIIFILAVCHKGFSKDVEIPLITVQVDSLVKEDFNTAMLKLSGNPDKTVGVFDLGLSISGLLGLSVNSSLLTFININNWISLPVFAAGGIGSDVGLDTGADGLGSVFVGSGIIVKNRYFLLGLMAGLYSETVFRHIDEKEKTTNFDFGIYPVFNTSQYPWLSLVEKIYGYLVNTEPEVSDIKINSFNYLLNLTFKRFTNLSVLELYTRRGTNDFIPGYDFSNIPVFGGDTIYKTYTYGLKIGIDPFWVDLNYLIVEGELLTYKYTGGKYVGDEYVFFEYVDYEYPLNLNGFLAVTFNFSMKALGGEGLKAEWFLRFSTFSLYHASDVDMSSDILYGLMAIPSIGVKWGSDVGSAILSWGLYSGGSFSMRVSW